MTICIPKNKLSVILQQFSNTFANLLKKNISLNLSSSEY